MNNLSLALVTGALYPVQGVTIQNL